MMFSEYANRKLAIWNSCMLLHYAQILAAPCTQQSCLAWQLNYLISIQRPPDYFTLLQCLSTRKVVYNVV